MLNYYDYGINFQKMIHSSAEDLPKPVKSRKTAGKSAFHKPHCTVFAADAGICLLYKTLLQNWNYEVTEGTSVKEIIRLAELKQPDIVLMDTEINVHDSLLMMKELKSEETLSKIPFILLSGHAQPEIRQSAIAAGATEFCIKPIDFSVLESIIERCLNDD